MEHADYYLPEHLMAKLSPDDRLIEQPSVTDEKPSFVSRKHLTAKFLSVRRLMALAQTTGCQLHEAIIQAMYIISTTLVPKDEDERDPDAQRVMTALYRRLEDIEVLVQDAINRLVTRLIDGLNAKMENPGEPVAARRNLQWARIMLGIQEGSNAMVVSDGMQHQEDGVNHGPP
ncbi:MAG: hypothetical protein WD314_08300 [Trueperaceae bacterium]